MSEHGQEPSPIAPERPLNRRAALRGGAALGLLGTAGLLASDKASAAAEVYVQVAPSSSSDNVIQATGDYTALVLRKPSSSAAQNLLEIQDSGGSLLSGIGPDGRFGIGTPPGSNQLAVVEPGSGWAANAPPRAG
jgi:hypothetical protein